MSAATRRPRSLRGGFHTCFRRLVSVAPGITREHLHAGCPRHRGYSSTVVPIPPQLPAVVAEKTLGEVVDSLAPAARDFAEKVSGSAASELGELFADKIRFRRWKNQVRLLNRASEFAQEAGIDPASVNLTILTPLLEKAGNEEDELMADRWAALLANAAGGGVLDVSPSFPDVLARLSPGDAQVLDAVHLALVRQTGEALGVVGVAAEAIADHYGWPVAEVAFSLENLQVLGLCASGSPATVDAQQGRPKQGLLGSDRSYVVETEFARRFLMACTPPLGDRATQAGPRREPPGEPGASEAEATQPQDA